MGLDPQLFFFKLELLSDVLLEEGVQECSVGDLLVFVDQVDSIDKNSLARISISTNPPKTLLGQSVMSKGFANDQRDPSIGGSVVDCSHELVPSGN